MRPVHFEIHFNPAEIALRLGVAVLFGLACGAVGLACGAGYYVIAAITFGFTVAIVTGMYLIERWLNWRDVERQSDT